MHGVHPFHPVTDITVAVDGLRKRFEDRLLHARGENLLAIVGCIERRGDESISDINNSVIRQYDGGPTPMSTGRYAALSGGLRFFQDWRFTIVSKNGEVSFLSLFCRHSRARENLRSAFARHRFLIRVFADVGRRGATGQPCQRKNSQPGGSKVLPKHTCIVLRGEVKKTTMRYARGSARPVSRRNPG